MWILDLVNINKSCTKHIRFQSYSNWTLFNFMGMHPSTGTDRLDPPFPPCRIVQTHLSALLDPPLRSRKVTSTQSVERL